MKTPVTLDGLTQYDMLAASAAVVAAWREPGPRPEWHYEARGVVREAAPLLVGLIEELASTRYTLDKSNHTRQALAELWAPSLISIKRWRMRRRVRNAMPVLAHCLDRLTLEQTGLI